MSETEKILVDNSNEQELNQEQIDAEVAELAPLACTALKESGVGDWDVKSRFKEEMAFSIVRFTWRNILGNLWCNGVCWGQSRVGKTTAVMRLSFAIYHDWDCVLKSIGFGLNSIVFKMDKKIPLTILEQADKIYHRVPILCSDDSGCVDNKSITMNDESFNFLKGGIDLWGTRLANLWHTLNQPSELTAQLSQKYTAELYVEKRGEAKFDTCKWQPNFFGWVPNQKKRWKQSFLYDKVPIDVYREYALKRDEMIDIMNQRFRDKQADTQIVKLLQRCTSKDFEVLGFIKEHGSLSAYDVENKYELDKAAIGRLKSRDLLESTATMTKHYKLDIAPLGLELLRVKAIVDDPEAAKKELRKNDEC